MLRPRFSGRSRLPGILLLFIGLTVRFACAAPHEMARVAAISSSVTSIAFAPAEDTVVFGSKDDRWHVWSVGRDSVKDMPDGGAFLAFVKRRGGAPIELLTVAGAGTVNLYDPITLKRDEWISQRGNVAALSPDGRQLLTSEGDLGAPLRLWKLSAEMPSESGTVLPRLDGVNGEVVGIGVGANATPVVLGGTLRGSSASSPQEGFMVFWDRTSGEMPTVQKEASAILQIAVNRDRTVAAAVGYDGEAETSVMQGSISLWDVVKRQRIMRLPLRQIAATCVAFSPDGNVLASGAEDGSLRLWDVSNGRMRAMLACGSAPLRALAFSPSGRLLAVGGGDGVVRVIDLAP